MFGYIRPLECELRVREQMEYRAIYCGLCKTLQKRYGQPTRLALNYDCAFLAALCLALGDAPHPSCRRKRCLLKPFRGKNPVAEPSEALDYAADVNVLLAFYQLADDWTDERRLAAWIGQLVLKPYARKAAEKWPALDTAMTEQLARLHALERKRAACTDEPSDAFGALLREVALAAPNLRREDRAAAAWMFYNLGRWVYLIDAWDDRTQDQKHGAYNPFLVTGMDRDAASFLLYVSLSEAEKGYDLLPVGSDMGLLDNIVHFGCRNMSRQVLDKGETHESV